MATFDLSARRPRQSGEIIEHRVLDSDQDSVVFEDISDEYNWLEIVIEGQFNGSDNGRLLPIFNGDDDESNYQSFQINHSDDSYFGIRSSELGFIFPESEKTSQSSIGIRGYSNSEMVTTYHNKFLDGNALNGVIYQGWWDDTSVVDKIELQLDKEQWASGSELTLVGYR